MQTEAHFENIQEIIISELQDASFQILIAVAWFTDKLIFKALQKKLVQDIDIQLILINDEINKENSPLNFEILEKFGGKIFFVGNKDEASNIMHNKFCVIDKKTVINGSYNWSKRAQFNDENIVVIKDNEIGSKFSEQFNTLLKKYGFSSIDSTQNNIPEILKRLELIKNLISLKEIELISSQIIKIQNPENDSNISTVISLLNEKRFSAAVLEIEAYTKKYSNLIVFDDVELHALKFELKLAELELISLSDKKEEVDKLISDFNLMHNEYLGDLIKELLELRKKRLEKEADVDTTKRKEYEKAKNEYYSYKNQYKELKAKEVQKLTEKEKKELKKLYRKGTLLCHPDKVHEKYKSEAEKTFIELNKAYKDNNLARVKEILNNLQNNHFVTQSDVVTELHELRIKLNSILEKITTLKSEIEETIKSDTYKEIYQIDDWNDYFSNLKIQLQKKLKKETNYTLFDETN